VAGDGTCDKCRPGWPSNCLNGSSFGNHGVDGGQGEAVRVPYADQTLVAVPGTGHDDDTLATLVALSDVMCTGHHTAVSASVKHGDTVAAVGDGAVRLCAVIAAKHLGTDRIISLSRNPTRQALAAELGATDIVSERGKGATIRINNMTNRIGVGAALECIGTGQSMATAFQHRPVGSVVGAIGAPHDVVVPIDTVIFRNIGLRGGVAPVRRYIPDLLPDVLDGTSTPDASSTTPPTSTALSTHTRPRTNAAPSNPASASAPAPDPSDREAEHRLPLLRSRRRKPAQDRRQQIDFAVRGIFGMPFLTPRCRQQGWRGRTPAA
jgi:threonine dehydrogenase-like Zn-dependent dehydrogenase